MQLTVAAANPLCPASLVENAFHLCHLIKLGMSLPYQHTIHSVIQLVIYSVYMKSVYSVSLFTAFQTWSLGLFVTQDSLRLELIIYFGHVTR